VCKASAPAGVPLEVLLAKYATCFKHASRRLVPGLNRPAVTACLFLLRLAGDAEASEGIVADRLLEALAFYWDSKKCRLPHSFFISALERFPAASGAVLTFLSEQLAAAAGATALNGRAEFLVAEAAKLSAAALSRRPGSAPAVAAAAGLQPSAVLRGLVAALGLKLSKASALVDTVSCIASHALPSRSARWSCSSSWRRASRPCSACARGSSLQRPALRRSSPPRAPPRRLTRCPRPRRLRS